jgi:hypothetical protein
VTERSTAANSTETTLAALLYSTTLSDQARTAGLATLALSLARDGQKERAELAAHTTIDVAILSPTMPDYNRSAVLAQAGQALAALGKNSEALQAYGTSAIIAERSGRLDPSYRAILLQGLANDVSRIGQNDMAKALRVAANSNPPPADASPYVLPSLLVPLLPDGASAWTDLEAAIAERESIATALIAALDGQSPTPSETVRQSLERVLQREDRLREQVYTAGIADGSDLLRRVAYARARMDWLVLKWRVARQGFGMALVPTWESQERDIEASLRQACDDYYVIVRDAAVSLPSQIQAVQGTIDVIQDQIKFGRLGWPPFAREGELLRSLDMAARQRMDLGIGSLYVTVRTSNGNSQLAVVSSQ